MAPEIILKKGHGPPVDIFACGVVCYAMLSGRLPFDATDSLEVYRKILTGSVMFHEEWNLISKNAKNFVKLLLHPIPESRPTASAALRHVWFDSVHYKETCLVSNCQSLSQLKSRRIENQDSKRSGD